MNQPPPYQNYPPPPQQQQYAPPQQQQYPPPPPQQHQQQPHSPTGDNLAGAPGTTYQGYVKGLHGWNDPPSLIGSSSKKHPSTSSRIDTRAVLQSVENPVAHVLVGLTSAMDVVKQKVIQDPIQRKVLEDTDKRLEELLERLGEMLVPDVILAHLVVLANAFNTKDLPTATKTAMTLSLMSTEHHEESHWIVGAKRLVEMYSRCVGVPEQQQQGMVMGQAMGQGVLGQPVLQGMVQPHGGYAGGYGGR
ncbi:hypothetical protein HDU98_001853 [Podochytrium sp. JEL0797]|nr:hypothetical protein HDU98_001853 [Podochytrium sp. JEL0797]